MAAVLVDAAGTSDGGAAPTVHPALEAWTSRDYLTTTTFASWTAIGILLSSFAVVITNTTRPNGELYVGTAMLVLGFFYLLLADVAFFRANWNLVHRPYIIALLILSILLLCLIVVLAVRLWIPFKSPKTSQPLSP